MLEKIGLPPKPSLKGNEWVLDASHCQGCSSAFTFFNRKHHCRRCGGIFCGNCTQQRINLRGQGEGPVRICDPCKKLEDAARFESRYGWNKVSKVAGSSKSNSSMDSDPLVKELLGHDSNTNSSERTALMDEVSELIAPKHFGSSSRSEQDKTTNDGLSSTQVTPEMLLLQAQEEKKQWLALKKEGKAEEALQAFKRGKEMERQAENLKLSLRRSQRKATTVTPRKEKHEEISKSRPRQRTSDSVSEDAEGGADKGVFQTKSKGDALKECKENKDDLMDALKEVGWSDADLQDAGGKQTKAKSVESELTELATAMHQGNNNTSQKSTSSMEVLAHKRRALALKREGHLAEAKEELKKAKLMERQLEEQQMFGGEDEESDDDLRAIIRDMDKESSIHNIGAMDMDFSILGDIHEDDDEGIDVTDGDMDDPDMVAALRSMGWEEEATQMERTFQKTAAKPSNTINVHKSQQHVPEGLEFLGGMDASLDDVVEATEDDMKDPFFLSALKAMGFEDEEPSKLMRPVLASIPKSEDKKRLQQEVLFLKKEALVLKRAGKLQEAREELRRAKQLEKELQEFDSQHNEEDVLAAFSVQQQPFRVNEVEAVMLPQTFDEDDENVDVTEEDMGDPELAKTLRALGWQEDHESDDGVDAEKDVDPSEESFLASHKLKSKSELQKELLGVKRAALKLRREGKAEEAEDELKKAHMLERLMEESGTVLAVKEAKHAHEQTADGFLHTESISRPGTEDPIMLASLKGGGLKTNGESLDLSSLLPFITEHTQRPREKIEKAHDKVIDDGRQSNLGLDVRSEDHSRTSSVSADVTFRPGIAPVDVRGKIVKGEDSLLPSTVVQVSLEETLEKGPALLPHRNVIDLADVSAQMKESLSSIKEPSGSCDMVQGALAPASSSTTTVLSSMQASQQEVLVLKRQALALKREGRLLEAKEKLREAKFLEKKLASDKTVSESSAMDEGQLSARRAELEPMPPPVTISAAALPKQAHTSPHTAVHKSTAGKDRMKLQQESLAHKRKALALRREGNTEAADMEFELAKSIEKQMEELGGIVEHNGMLEGDDAGLMNDIFDPQLLAALKGLGWKDSDILQPMLEVRQETSEKPQEANRRKSTEVPLSATRLQQSNEKEQLEEKIRSEKIRAVRLKRSGQQTEALDVLRGAKLLERKLQLMS